MDSDLSSIQTPPHRPEHRYMAIHRRPTFWPLFLLLISLVPTHTLVAQSSTIELTQQMLASTNRFLQSLDPAQRERAQYAFADAERLNWHFIPKPRNGIPLKELSQEQTRFAMALLRDFLGTKGQTKSERIRGLENVLAASEQNGRFVRDPDLYYLTVFGTPAADGEWALRYEGHHQAFNWSFGGGTGIASTPQFFGSNPAEVREGPQKGLRVLAAEEDMGRELVKSLAEEQRRLAILDGAAPNDIYSGAQKEATPLQPQGIRYDALDSQQKLLLLRLVEEVASAQPAALAEQRLAEIAASGYDQVSFAWIGGIEKGDAHYYRIQGTDFLIEFDNTQNEANHIHLVWRDFAGDFGRDLIRQHYEAVAAVNGDGSHHQ